MPNHEIILDEETSKRLNQKRIFIDFYFPEKKLALEYDSFEYHETPKAQGKDLIRAYALEQDGIKVTRFSTFQLYNREEFNVFLRNLVSRLDIRVRIRAKAFQIAHKHLRNLLPKK